MTLLDFYGGEQLDHALYWSAGNSNGALTSSAGGRGGVGSCWTAPSSQQSLRRFTASSKVYVGIAMAGQTLDASIRPYIALASDSGVTQHLLLGFNNNLLALYRGTLSTPLATVSMSFANSTFVYVEVEATIHDTTGICNVRVNQVPVINFSGDTRNGGTSTNMDGIWIGANGSYTAYFDDMYICNDQGSAPTNTFLGDIRVNKLSPTGPGNSTQWTPDTGANWSRVSETPYSNANYVQTLTAGHKDTYAMADVATNLQVLGVKTNAIAKNPDGGTVSIRNVTRSGGTDYTGSSVVLNANDALVSTLYTANPNGGAAWTPTSVNALEAGVERV